MKSNDDKQFFFLNSSSELGDTGLPADEETFDQNPSRRACADYSVPWSELIVSGNDYYQGKALWLVNR